MKKILVLRGGALGDFIVTLPALALLRSRWPAARLELAGNATAASLALTTGLLDAAYSQHEARWAALFAAAPLPPEFSDWLAPFDLVLNFWPDPANELARHFPRHDRQIFLTTPAHPSVTPAAHHYCDALCPLGLRAENFQSRLPVNEAARDATIAIHPGSGSPRKNWPVERWAELCAQLSGPLLLVLGEAERETCRSLLAADDSIFDGDNGSPVSGLLPRAREIACNLPLPDLAARLARCRLFVGHDSGVSHLAAAVGTPCLLLFGPTDAAMWAPPGPHVRVLQARADFSNLTVAQVRAAIDA